MPEFESPELRNERQFLVLDDAPILKRERDPMKKLITPEQAARLQAGQDIAPAGATTAAPGPTVQTSLPGVSPAPIPMPVAQPQMVPGVGVTTPALPAGSTEAPVVAGDSERVQKRINRLFGQRMAAEERNGEYERQISELQTQVAGLQRPATTAPAQNYTPQYQAAEPYGPVGQAEPASAGDLISRSEVQNLFSQQTQALSAAFQTQQAQIASRASAELEFPDVYGNPTLRQAAEQILESDPHLRADPRGPMKAALMARGLTDGGILPQTVESGLSTDARKQALSGPGATVPQGTPNAQGLVQQYQAALDRAKASQDDMDFVRARELQKQILALQAMPGQVV